MAIAEKPPGISEEARLRIQARINEAIRDYQGRDPRYRYFETSDGWRFHWTTERMGDEKYASAIYMPKGEGARSGKQAVTRLVIRREMHHKTRTAAKARALKLYREHAAELAAR